MPSPFPCSPVICECLWKKTQIEKKTNKKKSLAIPWYHILAWITKYYIQQYQKLLVNQQKYCNQYFFYQSFSQSLQWGWLWHEKDNIFCLFFRIFWSGAGSIKMWMYANREEGCSCHCLKAAYIFCINYSIKTLTVNTISIWGSIGNTETRGTFFVALDCANYNRWLWNYKIIQFTVFVRDGWWADVKLWTFAGCGGGHQNQKSANKGKKSLNGNHFVIT